jgi:lipopolysaccharide/colanic/teichoic acid biosynthesis glycosyltransferase
MDIFLSLFLIIVLSPILLVVGVWVRIDTGENPIFKQKRPGYHREIFTIYKFKTMMSNTTLNGKNLSDDERMTKSGRFLRKTSIDELPQLLNILKGEMSFIGPRPFLINDLGSYNYEQLIRFEVLPGITSWTAIHGRNNIPIQEKYNYEIYYVKNIRFLLDLKIFLKTIFLVLSQKNVNDNVNSKRIGAEICEDDKATE